MTAKEKALQLVNEFSLVGLQQREEGIACALIAVDEILSVIDGLFTEPYLDSLDEKQYWEQVKIEIENL